MNLINPEEHVWNILIILEIGNKAVVTRFNTIEGERSCLLKCNSYELLRKLLAINQLEVKNIILEETKDVHNYIYP